MNEPYDEFREIDSMYNDLGRAVVEWNHAEWHLARIICLLSDQQTAEILTAHMKSNGLCDALRSFSSRLDEDGRETLNHATLMFERLREYRNHFVHRTTCVIPSQDEIEGAWAFTLAISARKGFKVEDSEYSHRQLMQFRGSLSEFSDFLTSIEWVVRSRNDPAQHGPPRSWPEKPPVPDMLAKTLTGFPDELYPPQSSRQ